MGIGASSPRSSTIPAPMTMGSKLFGSMRGIGEIIISWGGDTSGEDDESHAFLDYYFRFFFDGEGGFFFASLDFLEAFSLAVTFSPLSLAAKASASASMGGMR